MCLALISPTWYPKGRTIRWPKHCDLLCCSTSSRYLRWTTQFKTIRMPDRSVPPEISSPVFRNIPDPIIFGDPGKRVYLFPATQQPVFRLEIIFASGTAGLANPAKANSFKTWKSIRKKPHTGHPVCYEKAFLAINILIPIYCPQIISKRYLDKIWLNIIIVL